MDVEQNIELGLDGALNDDVRLLDTSVDTHRFARRFCRMRQQLMRNKVSPSSRSAQSNRAQSRSGGFAPELSATWLHLNRHLKRHLAAGARKSKTAKRG